MAKIEPFEKYSDIYENWFLKNEYAYKSEIEAIRMLLPREGNGVEIGVGSGRFAIPLGIKVGVEPSDKMGDIAKRRGIKVIKGVAEALPIEDKTFDFVLMVTTVCFVDDIEKAFSEAYRVLKDKGSLLVAFVDRESLLGKEYEFHKNQNLFYRFATFYSTSELIIFLKKVGFENFYFLQTIFHRLEEIRELEPIKEGYGEGSFVVIKAVK